jgi:hypothetical protein
MHLLSSVVHVWKDQDIEMYLCLALKNFYVQ